MSKIDIKVKEKFNLKKEIAHLPGYIIVGIWVIFTFILIGVIFEHEGYFQWKHS
jgi:hypothetical protein